MDRIGGRGQNPCPTNDLKPRAKMVPIYPSEISSLLNKGSNIHLLGSLRGPRGSSPAWCVLPRLFGPQFPWLIKTIQGPTL